MKRMIIPMLALALGAVASSASADDWPTKPITIINPFAAGGPAGLQGQALSEYLTPILGQPIIVESKPGAGATLAGAYVAAAEPDGYTLMIAGPPTYSINTKLIDDVPYEGYKAFDQVSMMSKSTNGIAVNTKSGINSIDELVAKAKEKPGEMTFGSPGLNSVAYLGMLKWMEDAGIKLTHVPYRGGAPVVADILANNIDVAVINAGPLVPGHESGDLKILATTSLERYYKTPNVPTMDELGYKGLVIEVFNSISGPKGMPKEVIQKLSDLFGQALQQEEVITKFQNAGLELNYMPHEEAQAYVAKNSEDYYALLEKEGITSE